MAMLDVRSIYKHFGGLQAVNDCSLKVEQHQIVGLIGPNGAGKTTLFNIIAGFLPPTKGEVWFNGKLISGLKPHQIASQGVARTFQIPHGFPRMTVMENLIAAPMGQKGESLWKIITAPGQIKEQERIFKEKALKILQSLDMLDKRNEMVGNLSAGEARILELARQLMLDPEILLLDEPAAGINPAFQSKLMETIRDIRDRGQTFLIVDHNLGFIMGLSDYIYVMDRGEIITEGTPEAVIKDRRVKEVYLGGAAWAC